jgi:hypothetical protein
MTAERDFDRIAAAWLLDGPTELPDRVIDAVVDEIHLTRRRRALGLPWRFPTMTSPVRLAALVAVVALIAIGALALGVGRSAPAPSEAPTTAPATAAAVVPSVPSTIGVPVLDRTFTSDRMGYSIKIPAGASVTPATQSWAASTEAPVWGSPQADQIVSDDIRLIATQQKLPAGRTPEQWMASYCALERHTDCANAPASWEKIKVAGVTAYVDQDGIPAAEGTIAPGGRLYEALLTTPSRTWVFTMDGNLDRAVFDAFLKTIVLQPSIAVDTPPLTSTFTSPTNGFSISTVRDWTTDVASRPWTGVDNQSDMMDAITITGTDTSVLAASQPLGRQTFSDFLAAFHANTKANVPEGCDGGEPSAWPTVPVGDQQGHLEMLCNAAEVLADVGGRVYVFDWGNDTFTTDQHLPLQAWKEVLKTVRFTPETAR